MKCESDYCIYNRNFYCLLENFSINSQGGCNDCIIISIPIKDLERLKEEQLADIEGRNI